jgi:hypothetical protein
VNSLSRISHEYNGKIRWQPELETSVFVASGGGYGSDVEPSLRLIQVALGWLMPGARRYGIVNCAASGTIIE